LAGFNVIEIINFAKAAAFICFFSVNSITFLEKNRNRMREGVE